MTNTDVIHKLFELYFRLSAEQGMYCYCVNYVRVFKLHLPSVYVIQTILSIVCRSSGDNNFNLLSTYLNWIVYGTIQKSHNLSRFVANFQLPIITKFQTK